MAGQPRRDEDGNWVFPEGRVIDAAIIPQILQAVRPAAAVRESVRLEAFDGSTDIENFLNLFQHLNELYEWDEEMQLAKLKTSLTGKAAECAAYNTVDGIKDALRARFGITPAEAKRSLLAMKTGQQDRLRELADRIQKLTTLAYPHIDGNLLATLALDQFKRCISTDMSVFLISRPPGNMEEAVRTCMEYQSAGGKRNTGRAQINALTNNDIAVDVPPMQAAAATTREHVDSQVAKEIKGVLTSFEASLATCMNQVVQTCEVAMKRQVELLQAQRVAANPINGRARVIRKPPSACYNCLGDHWYADCPEPRSRKQNNQQNIRSGHYDNNARKTQNQAYTGTRQYNARPNQPHTPRPTPRQGNRLNQGN